MNNQAVEDVIDLIVSMIYFVKNKHKKHKEQTSYIQDVQEQLNTVKEFVDCVAFSYYPSQMLSCAVIQAYQRKENINLDFVEDTIGRLPILDNNDLDKYKQIEEKYNGKYATYQSMIEILEELNPSMARKIETMKELNILEDDILNSVFSHNANNDSVLSKVRKNKTILSLSDTEIENLGFYNFYLNEKSMVNAYISAETESIINQNMGNLQKIKNHVLVIPKTEEMILTNNLDNKSVLKSSLMKHLEKDDFQTQVRSVWVNDSENKDIIYQDDFRAYTQNDIQNRGRK